VKLWNPYYPFLMTLAGPLSTAPWPLDFTFAACPEAVHLHTGVSEIVADALGIRLEVTT
jgi:hypothetical protein